MPTTNNIYNIFRQTNVHIQLRTVLAAKDGTVYVGYQNGLGIVAHGETTVKQVFTTMDGLGSNWINCLLEDKQGYIWIGTNSGFSCYDKSINQFYNYYDINWKIPYINRIVKL